MQEESPFPITTTRRVTPAGLCPIHTTHHPHPPTPTTAATYARMASPPPAIAASLLLLVVLLLLLLPAQPATATATATATASEDLCERIGDLPPECACRDGPAVAAEYGPLSLVVECLRPFDSSLFNDTVGLSLLVQPCSDPGSSVSLNVTDLDRSIDYTVAHVGAGEREVYPIPGLSIGVPSLGHLGVDAVILVQGNPDRLTLNVGMDACLAVGRRHVCAEAVPALADVLPWWILKGTYTFGHICEGGDGGGGGGGGRFPMDRTPLLRKEVA